MCYLLPLLGGVVGIDDEGITTMQDYIDSGRFPRSHYINMWSKRLEGLGVTIVRVPREDQPSFMQDPVENNCEANAQHADNEKRLPAAPTVEERERGIEESDLNQVMERDGAVLHAAEGVLRKLHEGDPDPARP